MNRNAEKYLIILILPILTLISIPSLAGEKHYQWATLSFEQTFDSLSNGMNNWRDTNFRYLLQAQEGLLLSLEFSQQHHFGEPAGLAGFGLTQILSDRWYYNVNFISSNIGFFLPKKRFDLYISKKWLENKPLVSTIGYTYSDAKDYHYDRTYTLELIYYFPLPWIVEASLKVNDSKPGNVVAIRKALAVSFGRDKQYYLVGKVDRGNEAYQLIGEENVVADFSSVEYTATWRQWLGKNNGFNLVINHYISESYERNGIKLGLFFDL